MKNYLFHLKNKKYVRLDTIITHLYTNQDICIE